ncbi:MAG: acyltransferase [Clostridia bacterium]|nr:acyltransferase [Clostridia bacterium]
MIKKLFLPGQRNTTYADAADFMRVAALFFVAWFHIWQQSWLAPVLNVGPIRIDFNPCVRAGYIFVDFLILLSGFLLYLPYANRKTSKIGDFYRRRAVRILPGYLFAVLVIFFCFALPQKEYASSERMWSDLLSHLTFTHTFSYNTYVATKLDVVLWTLAIEVQFYLIFPFVAKVFRKRPAACYAVMILIAQFWRVMVFDPAEDTNLLVNQLPAFMDAYANGMLAASLYVSFGKKRQSAVSAWLNTLLTVVACVVITRPVIRQSHLPGYEEIRRGQINHRFILTFFGGVFLVCGSRSIALLRHLLSNTVVRFLSGISFNFYIWHQYLAVQLKKWHIPAYFDPEPFRVGEQPWQLQYTLLCFGLSLVLAVLITYLIEKPLAKRFRP